MLTYKRLEGIFVFGGFLALSGIYLRPLYPLTGKIVCGLGLLLMFGALVYEIGSLFLEKKEKGAIERRQQGNGNDNQEL